MGVEYSVDPSSTSGGLYHRVTTSLEYVFVGTDLARARPADRHGAEPPSSLSRSAPSWGDCARAARAPRAPVLTEVSQLQFPSLADKQVLRLQVPVQDLAAVAVGKAPEQLEHENLREEGARTVSRGRRECVPPGRPCVSAPWLGGAVRSLRATPGSPPMLSPTLGSIHPGNPIHRGGHEMCGRGSRVLEARAFSGPGGGVEGGHAGPGSPPGWGAMPLVLSQ